MKKFRPVIITAIILVIVIAAALCAMKFIPALSPAETPADDEIDDTSIRITDYNAEDIVSIEFVDANGGFVIDYAKEKIGISAKVRDADPRLRYDEYEMTTLPLFVAKLVASEEIGEEDASLFGFDSPKRKIILGFKNGESATILVGDDLPVGDGSYVKCSDSATIYTVGNLTEERLMIQRKDFLSFTLCGRIENANDLAEVEYTPYGKAPIKVIKRSEEEISADAERMGIRINYKLTSPVSAIASPDTLSGELLEKVIAIEGMSVIEELPQDLAKYGLDKPAKLRFATDMGVGASMLIGGKSELGGNYVMLENVPVVIETMSAIGLEELDHTDITLKLIFFFNSNEVGSFDYEFASGEKHTLDMYFDGKTVQGSLDGRELAGRNAANIFQRTIRFSLAGEVGNTENLTAPEIKITANLLNGKKRTMNLYRMNERQYAAEVDGRRAEFYVPVSEVRELTEAFEIVSRGEEIPDMF